MLFDNTSAVPNSFGGLTISGANAGVKLGANQQIPSSIIPTFGAATEKIDLAGYTQTLGGLSSQGIIDNTAAGTNGKLILAPATAQSSATVVQNTAGTLALTMNGPAMQTLSGANTFIGAQPSTAAR